MCSPREDERTADERRSHNSGRMTPFRKQRSRGIKNMNDFISNCSLDDKTLALRFVPTRFQSQVQKSDAARIASRATSMRCVSALAVAPRRPADQCETRLQRGQPVHSINSIPCTQLTWPRPRLRLPLIKPSVCHRINGNEWTPNDRSIRHGYYTHRSWG